MWRVYSLLNSKLPRWSILPRADPLLQAFDRVLRCCSSFKCAHLRKRGAVFQFLTIRGPSTSYTSMAFLPKCSNKRPGSAPCGQESDFAREQLYVLGPISRLELDLKLIYQLCHFRWHFCGCTSRHSTSVDNTVSNDSWTSDDHFIWLKINRI